MTLQANPNGVCKTCDRAFLRFRTMQQVCGPSCARKSVNAAKKAEAEQTRARRVALKSRRDWMDEAQKAVNSFVRARDRGQPCISSGARWNDTFQAGHYLSCGARPELRFNLDNIHGQSVRDNMHLHGNQAMYRIGLVARIGLERVEALEGPHPPAKWRVDELKTIRDGYRLLTKQLIERQRETQELCAADPPPEPSSPGDSCSDAQRHPKPTDAALLR